MLTQVFVSLQKPRVETPKGIAGTLNSQELRYGHYSQTTDLVVDVISVNLKYNNS